MLRMCSKIAMLNILKTSLSLKMYNVYISNDRIIMSLPHFYSIFTKFRFIIMNLSDVFIRF